MCPRVAQFPISASNFQKEIQILGLSEAKVNQSIVYTTNSGPYNLLKCSTNETINALAKSFIDKQKDGFAKMQIAADKSMKILYTCSARQTLTTGLVYRHCLYFVAFHFSLSSRPLAFLANSTGTKSFKLINLSEIVFT